jgi:hypothetical protein
MSKYKGRTTRKLNFQGDIWPIIDQWAQQNDFALVEEDEGSRIYQRGKGRGKPANMLRIGREDGIYLLEAWIRFGGWLWFSNAMVFPREMIVDGGGAKARPARDKAKGPVNLLLQALGEPVIP